MRTFLAEVPSSEAQEAAARVIERLGRPGGGVAGGERGTARGIEAARAGVAGHTRFEAALGAAGAFPNASRARVLWLGLSEGAEALGSLAHAVEQALRRHGF